jgi:hypothetical protein
MATEIQLTALAGMSEMPGAVSAKYPAQWRANYPLKSAYQDMYKNTALMGGNLCTKLRSGRFEA